MITETYKVEEFLSKTRGLDECKVELEREIGIRVRCYRKWIAQGTLSRTDAADRFERLVSALQYLDTITVEPPKTLPESPAILDAALCGIPNIPASDLEKAAGV